MEKELQAQIIGETFVDLVSEQKGTTLQQSDTFTKSYGGHGFLTAVAFSRLGGQTGLSSLIGADDFGSGIIEELKQEKVAIINPLSPHTASRFIWFENDHEAHNMIYHEDVHLDLPKFGLCFSIIFATYLRKNNLLKVAKEKFKGGKVAFILDETIQETDSDFKEILDLASLADIVFSFGIKTNAFLSALDGALKQRAPSAVIERYQGVFDIRHRLEEGSLSLKSYTQLPYQPAKIPSFVASYCLSWSLQKDLAETKTFVNQVIALASNRSFTAESLPFKSELKGGQKSLKEVELIHNKMLSKDLECLCFLTFDQTAHFEELARTLKRSSQEIAEFKELIYNAFIKTATLKHNATLGICVDNSHGREILGKSLGLPFALMRTVDEETKRAFLDHPYSLVRSWPRKEIIKVLFKLKDGEMPEGDVVWLKRFSEAVKETGHRFLIEIYDKEIFEREERVLATMLKIYKNGIYPTLWKLQPSYNLEQWRHFEECLEAHDPACGILILGDRLPIKQLAAELKELKEKTHKIKGFAIGRSLWQTVAEHWFEKRISNEMVESEVAFNFRRLLRIWENPQDYHAEDFDDTHLQHLKR